MRQYTPMTKKALQICFQAHKDQVDKSGLPYVFHPFHLAEQMEKEDEICVALLHDVLEDTNCTLEDLRAQGFSEDVLMALDLLNHRKTVPYMDYISALRTNPLARKVKLADLEHNSDSRRLDTVTKRDLERLEKYRAARALLEEAEQDIRPGSTRRIALDGQRLCFLTVYFRKNGRVDRYSLDIETAGDSHYQFSPRAAKRIQTLVALPGETLEQGLARFLTEHGEGGWIDLLHKHSIPFQEFHFR